MKRRVKDNHPQKGSIISVEPIRDTKDIEAIKLQLKSNPRDFAYFTLAINCGIRAGDLLNLKVGDVRNLKVGDTLTIRETKTNKKNVIVMNKAIYKAIKQYLETANLTDIDWLFKSKKGSSPISVASVNHLIKGWCKTINLKGNYGAHSLRKTFGYQQRVKYGVDWLLLCKRFNHSSPAITARYLGIEDKEINNILLNEI
jgi:integrase